MRRLLVAVCFALPLLAACGGKHAVDRTSIDGFENVLIERLRKLGALTELTKHEGGKAPIFTKDAHFSLPAAALPPGKLSEIVKEILQSWGDSDVRKGMEISGSGYHTHFNFGDADSHVFVDVIARPDQSATFIDLLIRGVE